MSRIPEETDANANLSLIKSRSRLVKQKASSNKSENRIAFKAGNITIPAKKSKRKITLAEELSDQEKETVIQEVLGYMLGHRPSLVSLSEPKEKLATVVSDHQHQLLPSGASFQVCQQPTPKPFVSAKLATNHIHLDGRELKSAPTTTSSSNRRSRYWERKRSTQLLQNDKVDRLIAHHNIKPQSAIARARTSLTSGAHYWPRVLVSSDLNNLLSRLHADNATM